MTQRPVQMIFENQKQLLQSKRENFDRGHAFIGQKIDSLIYIYNFFFLFHSQYFLQSTIYTNGATELKCEFMVGY